MINVPSIVLAMQNVQTVAQSLIVDTLVKPGFVKVILKFVLPQMIMIECHVLIMRMVVRVRDAVGCLLFTRCLGLIIKRDNISINDKNEFIK